MPDRVILMLDPFIALIRNNDIQAHVCSGSRYSRDIVVIGVVRDYAHCPHDQY